MTSRAGVMGMGGRYKDEGKFLFRADAFACQDAEHARLKEVDAVLVQLHQG